MGSVDYMAPEQAFNSKNADARADIYSLGCTLFRLLTGQNMFEGGTLVEKLMAHQNQGVPSLTEIRPEVPPALAAIFERMVAKRPADRYQDMTEVEAALALLPSPMLAAGIVPRAGSDGNLTSLFTSIRQKSASGQPAIDGISACAPPPEAAVDGVAPTVTLANPLHATDPVSDRSIRMARHAVPPATSINRPPIWRQPLALVAGALGGFLLVALGIWVIIRDKDGNEVGRVKVPEGGTATIHATTQGDPRLATPANSTPPLARAPFTSAQAQAHQAEWARHLGTRIETTNSLGMKLVLIPPGQFLMGSTEEDLRLASKIAAATKLDVGGLTRMQDERPQHLVRITNPFRMSAHEVTIGQFSIFAAEAKFKTMAEEFGGNSNVVKPEEIKPENQKLTWRTPGYAVTDDSPVTEITWNEAVAFCNWLSEQEKLAPCYKADGTSWTLVPGASGYRLPTEAEWEYACRAGTTTQYSFGDEWEQMDNYGWSTKSAGGRPHAVGSLAANPFGLFDMHGNVWEWCHDRHDSRWYENSSEDNPTGPTTPTGRVERGGSWNNTPAYSRSSYRSPYIPIHRNNYRGFRLVLSSVGTPSELVASGPLSKPSVIGREDARRQILEGLLAKGGALRIFVGEELRVLPAKAKLPSEDFRLDEVSVRGIQSLTVADCKLLQALGEVPSLDLGGLALDPESFRVVTESSRVEGLIFQYGSVDENRLQQIVTTMPQLTKVSIADMPAITDGSLESIGRLKDLETLELISTRVTGKSFVRLRPLLKLRQLSLHKSPIETVADLPPFANLEWLALDYSRLTTERLEELPRLDRLKTLNLMFAPAAGLGPKSCANLPSLETLYLSETPTTDETLKHLVQMKTLKSLWLIKTKVSREGVAEFKRARPDCIVEWDGNVNP
ncbi:MAG: SUMF1/EgtB/PvdO family nonheme iron enzyme [Pirellulaceae bacterium]|nr:SUMF1/EgtB/PvdO family nonheme iron enzyme [Pirellulaceae bacterium]